MVFEEMLLEEFQKGCHLECSNGTILSTLSFHVAPMFPNKFGFNRTYGIISKWLSWPPLDISTDKIAILNFHATTMPPSKFQYMVWEESPFRTFQDSCQSGTTLAILNFHVATKHSVKFRFNLAHGLGGAVN